MFWGFLGGLAVIPLTTGQRSVYSVTRYSGYQEYLCAYVSEFRCFRLFLQCQYLQTSKPCVASVRSELLKMGFSWPSGCILYWALAETKQASRGWCLLGQQYSPGATVFLSKQLCKLQPNKTFCKILCSQLWGNRLVMASFTTTVPHRGLQRCGWTPLGWIRVELLGLF